MPVQGVGVRGPAGVLGHQGLGRGCRGVRGALGVVGGLGAGPHWVPFQGPITPTGRVYGAWGVGSFKRSAGGMGCVRDHWGGRWTGRLTTWDPSTGLQHIHWQGVGGMRGCQGCRDIGAIRGFKGC